jgi:phosphinothricin acetyltransferase
VYLEAASCGRGIGRRLYEQLLAELHAAGIHVALAGIALPKPASVALHEKLGFRKVGQLPQIGFKLGAWVDVGYWQRIP